MRHQEHRAPGIRRGLTLLACGVALGMVSAVAVVNALYNLVR